MEAQLLTVYKSPFPKLRIGKDYDGGYIICDIPDIKYDILIAGGVADDISFEEHLCNKYDLKCIAFDGTVYCTLNNTSHKYITFISKNIGPIIDNENTNLFPLINEYNEIFLKMDREGAELPWLKCLHR